MAQATSQTDYTQEKPAKHFVMAAGGTGGHMFPALALAEELIARGHRVTLMTDKRGKHFASDKVEGLVIRAIRAASPSVAGFHPLKKFSRYAQLLIGCLQSLVYFVRFRPDYIVGFGGYPSVPPAYVGHRLGVPVMLHESNAVIGRANKFLASKATRIAVAFPETEGLTSRQLEKQVWVGNPIRKDVAKLHGQAYPEVSIDGAFHVLIMGGSQGSRVFSDVVPEAIKLLPETLRQRLRLQQQCRSEDLERVQKTYKQLGVQATLKPFFNQMGRRLKEAHLVVCRAGASSVAEVMAAGRPTVFVPFPEALDDHQKKNAAMVEEAGGGWLMTQDGFTPAAFAARLEVIATLPEKLTEMSAQAKSYAKPQAALTLADLLEREIGINGNNNGDKADLPSANATAREAA